MDLATLFFHSPMHTRKEKRAIGRLREARTQSFFLGISVVDGPKAIYIRLADVMCSLLVVIYPCIHLVEVWHNNKIDSCREMNQKNHTTFHS